MAKSGVKVSLALIAGLAMRQGSSAQTKAHQPLLDARSAIRLIASNDPETKIENAERDFSDHAVAFCAHSAEESPAEAARGWLALLDEAIAIPHRSQMGGLGGVPAGPVGSLRNVLVSLPRPEAWPEIKGLVDERPASSDRTVLLMLCARLMGDDEGLIKLCDEYNRESPAPPHIWFPTSGTKGIRIEALRRLGRLTGVKDIEQALEVPESAQESYPNLLDVLPPKEAKDALYEVIRANPGWLQFRNDQNCALAKEVVLAHMDDLPKPPWFLTANQDDISFVRALIDHYGYSSLINSENQAPGAQWIYFRYLISNGKVDEAAKLLQDLKYIPDVDSQDWGPAKDVDLVIEKLQARLPTMDLWKSYVSAAIACGHTAQALQRIQAKVADAATPRAEKLTLIALLIGLHERIGDLKALEQDVATAEGIERLPSDADPAGASLQIGLVSGDKTLIEQGISHDVKADRYGFGNDLLQAMFQEGRLSQLENLELQLLEKNDAKTGIASLVGPALCAIYYNANRPLDIVALLKRFPYWQDDDLSKLWAGHSDIPEEENVYEWNQPTAFYAAWAFYKTGRADLAIRTLRNLLIKNENLPLAYSLLNEIGDPSTERIYYDVNFAHPVTPLPFLWKADWLLKQGKTKEVEACVGEAMALAPTFNPEYEEKLYTLWGQILQKEGEAQRASACAKKADAARLSAHALDLLEVGLLPQAHEELEKAVELWPENAVLQADLVKCLNQEGLEDEANQHYEKMFENLPDCLGEGLNIPQPVETLLYNQSTRQVGLDILTKRISDEPKNAAAYYVRATLYSSLGLSGKAIADLRKAVSIDPKHAGAWKLLAAIGEEAFTFSDARTANYALIDLLMPGELDSREGFELGPIGDLARAYRALEAKLRTAPKIEKGLLFPLHCAEGSRRSDTLSGFEALGKDVRFPGSYFQESSDILAIADLYHPTKYPFD